MTIILRYLYQKTIAHIQEYIKTIIPKIFIIKFPCSESEI